MTVYATHPDVSNALEIFDQLLGQNLNLDQMSLLSPRALGERKDSLVIPHFGQVWGLGRLSQASAVAAALSQDGRPGMEAVLVDLPAGLAAQIQQRLEIGAAVMEVSVAGGLDETLLGALLAAYGAQILN
ncbi:MAG: hypothetical protein J0I12_16015 [Candidatus Eremiobacteraeota bacterium]|nr:hypothetical protein [Candidatus Eremiobacteraeota bacterium]